MSGSTEEVYSAMFSSLRHPARRRILRMLSEKEMTFSQMLDELEIPGSHLTYHLESLGELIVKMEDGKYKLSSIGEASFSIMKGAEEAPSSQTAKFSLLPLRWKTLVTVFIIGITLLASISCIQYYSLSHLSNDYELLKADFEEAKLQNQQIISWSSAERAMNMIRDVVQIDTAKYQTTLLRDTIMNRTDLDGVVEEILRYSLTTNESKIDLVLRFRNNHFSLCQLSLIEGFPPYAPIYVQYQSTNILEATRGIIERYKSVVNEPYLEEMSQLLATANEANKELILGNIKLKTSIYGENAEVLLMYTANGFDYSAKSLRLLFHKNVLQELSDDWFLYTVGSTQVNFSREQAIQIARNTVKTFEWNVDGEQVSNFNVLAEPVSAVFFPHPRTDALTLIPYWFVTLYLDKEYPGGVNSITVGVWADTGKVTNVQPLSSQIGT